MSSNSQVDNELAALKAELGAGTADAAALPAADSKGAGDGGASSEGSEVGGA